MSVFVGSFLLLASLTVQSNAFAAPSPCPQLDLGETQEDCPWSSVARDLQNTVSSKARVTPLLSSKVPALHKQMISDSKRKGFDSLWGTSINYDELAKGTIVQPEILEAIAQAMKIRDGIRKPTLESNVKGELVHAGMEHTYGYLFSTLKTSFGYKRARWVRNVIESGFALPKGILSPNTTQGSLFSNVTYFTGRIAFRNEPEKLAVLKREEKNLPKALRDFKYGDLRITRLAETVLVPTAHGTPRKVILRTDLVPFVAESSEAKNTHLLVYSIVDPAVGGAKLITAFPVETSFVGMVSKPENLGENKPVITRYNGFVPDLTGKNLTGSRVLTPAVTPSPAPMTSTTPEIRKADSSK